MPKLKSLSGEEVLARLREANACWFYPGSPRKHIPHALLTSGKHSDGFVDVGQVLKENPQTRMDFAESILAALRQIWDGSFDRVVGADTSSTALAQDIARIAGVSHIRMLKTEDKRQLWDEENDSLTHGDGILHIEELITTSFSALAVRKGIREATGISVSFVPYLPVVVEGSDPENRVLQVEESRVLPLLQLSIRNYDPNPSSCPYCAVGSEALKPKEGNNWAILTSQL